MAAQVCGSCGAPTTGTWSVDDIWVCWTCVPDDIRSMYPGWTERQEQREKRAEQARTNFGKAAVHG